VRIVCQSCAAKPDLQLAKEARRDPASFVNRYVQLGFDIPDEPNQQEHIWVKIVSFEKKGRKTIFHGLIWNQPLFCPISHGDKVEFTANEIEKVCDESD
jgi:uncharacterized protein YegJ (DUF2314 family)